MQNTTKSALNIEQTELLNLFLSENDKLTSEEAFDLVSYYAGQNVSNLAEYNRYCLVCDHYEFFRSVYGHKPYGINYDSVSTEQLNAEIKQMVIDNKQQIQDEKLEKEEYSRFIQARKAKNAYKPNLAFGDLKSLIGA